MARHQEILIFFFVATHGISTFAADEITEYKIPHWIILNPENFEESVDKANREARKICLAALKDETEVSSGQVEAAHSNYTKPLFEWIKAHKASTSKDALRESSELRTLRKTYEELEAKRSKGKERFEDCRINELGKMKLEYTADLFTEPDEKSRKIGVLRVTQKREKLFEFVPIKGDPIPIQLDADFKGSLTDGHTVLASKGDWFKLPRGPFPQPVWVKFNAKTWGKVSAIDMRDHYLSVATPKGNRAVFLKKMEGGFFYGRLANDKDNPCSDLEKPPKEIPIKIPVDLLIDKDGHFRAEWIDPSC
jgi:hypothetical protein